MTLNSGGLTRPPSHQILHTPLYTKAQSAQFRDSF